MKHTLLNNDKMTPKEKAEDLVNQYRMILMNEDTDCGNEILCTIIAIQCAKVALESALSFDLSVQELDLIGAINHELEEM